MEFNNSEVDLWPEFPIAESHPQLNWEDLSRVQPDLWIGQGTETTGFDNEVLFLEASTGAAEQSSDLGSWWSDDYSLERSTESTLVASSEDQFTPDHQSSQSLSCAESSVGAKSHQRLPLEAVKALRQWLYQHQDSPYPTPDQRTQLEQQTGLNKTQVLNWFANARRRRRRKLRHAPVPMIRDSIGAVSTLSPLERWEQSPPEYEPAAASDIMRALENAPLSELPIEVSSAASIRPDSALLSGNSSGSSCSSRSSFLFGAPSMSEFENNYSSGSEISMPLYRQPQRPPTPIPSIGKRHRRRKNPRLAGRQGKPRTQDARIYQCTFCCDSFRTKYEWTRHEKALHISVDRWCCAPEGGLVEVDGVNVCVFCQAQNADDNHLETHNYLQCRDKAPALRYFSRKDHLRQHLRLVHDVEDQESLDKWRISLHKLHSRCGFCNSEFTTWDESGSLGRALQTWRRHEPVERELGVRYGR